jgi:oligoendopeptidase F
MGKTGSSADGEIWNFKGMYSSFKDPKVKKDIEVTEKKAGNFEKQYRKLIGPKVTPRQMKEALKDLEEIVRYSRKLYYYAYLNFSKNNISPEVGAFKQMIDEKYSDFRKSLIFFELAWCALDDQTAEKIIRSPELKKNRHYLEVLRDFKPHKLSEPEERVWESLSLTGNKAFIRLFDETMGRTEVKVKVGKKIEKMPLDSALTLIRNPDRNVRKSAHAAVTEALDEKMPLLRFIFNTLVQYHAIHDEFRKFKHPSQYRNIENEVDDKMVQALLDCVNKNIGLVSRYYVLKRRMLGLGKLMDYDRYAPITQESKKCSYKEAKVLCLDSYSKFSPKAGKIAKMFFDNGWIDAELKQGKEGGAFSASGTSDLHPFILLNYNDDLNDAMTMAHELGHGIHQYMARKQGDLLMDTSLCMAETASVFGEMLLFNRIVSEEKDPERRLALLCNKIEDTFATVFRQVMMNRFETMLHKARRSKGELKAEDINKMWKEVNEWMFGNSVEMTDGYCTWWSYVLHFIHYPFYTYAYSFGELMVLSLYEQYGKKGARFVDKYLAMLEAGGSEYPKDLIAKIGLDISDPKFWQKGMDFIEGMVERAEKEAKKLGC